MIYLRKLKVLFVASEAVPFVKTGGLGDVMGALPRELCTQGVDARIIMPYYQGGYREEVEKKGLWLEPYVINMGWRKQQGQVLHYRGEVDTYFIKNELYFAREELYGYSDDYERYAFFCRAVLEGLAGIEFIPDIIHCNDWQTGPICLLLKEEYSKTHNYSKIKTIFTIHNIQYQGIFGKESLDTLGISGAYFNPDRIEFYGNINYMKAGLVYSDLITTVSPSYAKEIQTPEYGYGLDGILKSKSELIYGIVNGIDDKKYNPNTDPYIYENYSIQDSIRKKENKVRFQQEFGLEQKDSMIIAIITRLAGQKGLDLFKQTIDNTWLLDKIMENDVQFIILGTGEKQYEEMFRYFGEKYPTRASVHITFNEELAQKIYAASDIFLMPSLFEPCGLGQLMAMKYGSIPIVRKTGGLKDTVIHYNYTTKEGTGFEFEEYSGYWLYNKIIEAYTLYKETPMDFEKLRSNAMNTQFGWGDSAEEYVGLYKKLYRM